jgi:valyl-tRNA synthetase
VDAVEIHLPLAKLVDIDVEKQRLKKELEDSQIQIERLEKLLKSDFSKKAPSDVVDKERDKYNSFKETAEKLKLQLKGLE